MSLVLDEFHLTVRVPAGRPEAVYAAARRALGSAAFRRRLREAVEAVRRRYPALAVVTFTLSR